MDVILIGNHSNPKQRINKNRTQLTIEPVPMSTNDTNELWKMPEITMGPAIKMNKDRSIPPISLTLIPVNAPKEAIVIKPTKPEQTSWKVGIEEYNALDKMKDFAEKASFEIPNRPKDKYNFDFTLMKTQESKKVAAKTHNKAETKDPLKTLLDSYSRIEEFMNGCDWTDTKVTSTDPKLVEQNYLAAKSEYLLDYFKLKPKETPKSVLKDVIELNDDNEILNDIISNRNKGVHTYNVGKDGALSISIHPMGTTKDKPYGLVRFLGP